MTDEKLALIYKNYMWHAGQIRGSLINEVIVLERLMDEYICSYFCADEGKKGELMRIIMATERITFENKRQVLKVIMEIRHPNVLENNKTMLKDMQFIAEERNMLAHYMLDFSDESVNGLAEESFTLTKFRNTVTKEVFDKERGTKLVNLINKYIQVFVDIHPVLNEKEITSSSDPTTPGPE